MGLTKEEVEDNYQFKVSKRLLMDRYPFIVDVDAGDQETLDSYNLIFLRVYVDGNKLQEYFKSPLIRWFYTKLNDLNYDVSSPYLSVLLKDRTEADPNPTTVQKNMDELLDKVRLSPAMPQELKLPNRRAFTVGTFIIDKDKTGNLLTWEGGQLVDNSPH